MSRSHPPTLLTLTTQTIRTFRLLGAGDKVLVAVSAGPDSMALLHVLALLRETFHHQLYAHGIDHGLRPEARQELDIAEQFARTLCLPFQRTSLHIRAGGNLQERARNARKKALQEAAAHLRADVIATAHHATDRAETVLMRLLRGAGPAGLAVLPARSGSMIRPFLRAHRWDIDVHINRHAIPFVVDPSNQDPRYTRARIRHELLPLLRTFQPRIEQHLCSLADQLSAWLPSCSQEKKAPPPFVTSSLPRATQEALRTLLKAQPPNLRITLPGGIVISCIKNSPLRHHERNTQSLH